MELIDKLKNSLKSNSKPEKEHIVIQPDEAPELARRTRKDEISNIKEREQKLIERTDEIMDNLEKGLEKVGDYEDIEGIKAAEDIAQSFYNSRKIMIENFNPENSAESYDKELEDFLREFNNMDRKEKALMDRMKDDVIGVAEPTKQLGEILDDLNEFNENQKRVLKDIKALEDRSGQYNEIMNRIGEKRNRIKEKEINIQELEDKIEDKKAHLDEIQTSQEWQKKQELEEEKEDVENKIKNKRRKLNNASSSLKRGLKKLIYQVENQNLDFTGNLQQLKYLKNQEYSSLSDIEDGLEEAKNTIRDEEMLEGRQMQEFSETVENMPDIEKILDEMDRLKSRKEDLENKIKDLEIFKEKRNTKNKIEELDNRKQSRITDSENLKHDISELEDERNRLKEDIRLKTEQIIHEEIKFEAIEK